MQYAPGITYRGDEYIAQGGRQMAGAMTQLLQYMLTQGQAKDRLAAQLEGMVPADTGAPTDSGPAAGTAVPVLGPGMDAGGAPLTTTAPAAAGGGGFNPVTPGVGAADGDSPAAQRGKQADAMRKLIMAYQPDAKDLHHAIKGMSVGQLEGAVQSVAINQAAQEHAARMQDYLAHAQLRQQQVQDDQSVGKLLGTYAKLRTVGTGEPMADGTTGPGGPLPPMAALAGATAAMGPGGGRVASMALDKLARYEQVINPAAKAGKEAFFDRSNLDPQELKGLPGMYRVPTGPNVSELRVAPRTVTHVDENENITGFTDIDAKGTGHFRPYNGPVLKQATDQNGNALEGWGVDARGRPVDMRGKIQKLTGEAPGAPAAAAGGGYKSKDDVVADYKGGKLTYEQASKILNEQFKVKR